MKRIAAIIFLVASCAWSYAYPRDIDNRYADSPLKEWFRNLKPYTNSAPCCDEADGVQVEGDDYETRDGHYWLRLDGEWQEVPDDRLITEPNRLGTAFVWTYGGGRRGIRCFMPAAGL